MDLAAAMLRAHFTDAGAENGAGIVVGQDDKGVLVVTAAHLLRQEDAPLERVEASFAHGAQPWFPAQRACEDSIDPELDVALLVIDAKGIPPLPLNTMGDAAALAEGSMLLPIGHANRVWDRPPAPVAFDPSGEQGFITYRAQAPSLTAYIEGGFSGGPVFDDTRSIVGMHLLRAGDRRRALPIDAVIAALRNCPDAGARVGLRPSMRTGPVCVGDSAPCQAIRGWKTAYERKDLQALRAVWPKAPRQVLDGNFRDSSTVQILWRCGRVELNDSRACVRCEAIQYDFAWLDPSRPRNRGFSEELDLRKRANGEWFIDAIRSSRESSPEASCLR